MSLHMMDSNERHLPCDGKRLSCIQPDKEVRAEPWSPSGAYEVGFPAQLGITRYIDRLLLFVLRDGQVSECFMDETCDILLMGFESHDRVDALVCAGVACHLIEEMDLDGIGFLLDDSYRCVVAR